MHTSVLMICHGTVDRVEDIPAFVSRIRRGRPTPPAIIEEVRARFERIGGSPLMRITREQAAALEARLGLPVRVAGRLWKPYPEEVIGELVREGTRKLVSLPMAPQSVDVYHATVKEVAKGFEELELVCVPPWGLEPRLIDAFVESIDEALARFPEDERREVPIVLSAHSLPVRVIAAGDLYESQFRVMAGEVQKKLAARGLAGFVAFQSQGMDGGDWIGPDLQSIFAELRAGGARSIVLAPIGFLAEHTETLYDLDIEASARAKEMGFERFERAAAVCARPSLIDALENVVKGALTRG